jgi:hypothetical protein
MAAEDGSIGEEVEQRDLVPDRGAPPDVVGHVLNPLVARESLREAGANSFLQPLSVLL